MFAVLLAQQHTGNNQPKPEGEVNPLTLFVSYKPKVLSQQKNIFSGHNGIILQITKSTKL